MIHYWSPDTFDVTSFKWNLNKRKNKIYTTSGSDNSNLNTYTYNSLGFRGDEFPFKYDKKVLMAVGCSHTEGVGIGDNQTWPYQLSNLLNYNHINFGFTGRSNDYMCRVILTYTDLVNPDFIFVLYTDTHRKEYYTHNGDIEPYQHNSWGWFSENMNEKTSMDILSNNNNDFINWYKNHLLITYYLKSKGIKWKWDSTFVETNYTDENKFNGSIKPFIDYSTDGNHPGPNTNSIYATNIYNSVNDIL